MSILFVTIPLCTVIPLKWSGWIVTFSANMGSLFISFLTKKMKAPSFEIEQDYFDWELARTGIEEM